MMMRPRLRSAKAREAMNQFWREEATVNYNNDVSTVQYRIQYSTGYSIVQDTV